MVRAGVATDELITHTVHRMVESAPYNTRAAQVREQIGHYRSGERFQTFVDGLMQNGKTFHASPQGGMGDGLKNGEIGPGRIPLAGCERFSVF